MEINWQATFVDDERRQHTRELQFILAERNADRKKVMELLAGEESDS